MISVWQCGRMWRGKRAEGRRARAARVDDGGDAGVDAAEVGIDAGAVDALEDVRVQVDQPGRDELARRPR